MAVTKNFFSNVGNADDLQAGGSYALKLSVDHKHIRYFIVNEMSSTVLFYGDHTLHGVNTDEELTAQMESILAKDTFLNRSFSRVTICWHTDFEIVPTLYFDQQAIDPSCSVVDILNSDAKFLYSKISVVASPLAHKFPLAVHTHTGAAMIDQIRDTGTAGTNILWVNINADDIDLLYLDDAGSLKLYNTYEYKTYQDYIYYLLLVADEMKLDRDSAKAILMGEISSDSKLYEMTNRYFNQTAFMTPPLSISFTAAFSEYPRHFNYLLYNL